MVRHAIPMMSSSGYVAEVQTSDCEGCGRCEAACPFGAVHVNGKAQVDRDVCLGCGVCVPACPEHGLTLIERDERVITPVDSVHRTVAMAVERGTLQHLIFDNHALASHRAMAAVLGAILRLPPVQKTMAKGQLGSRYLEKLIEWNNH